MILEFSDSLGHYKKVDLHSLSWNTFVNLLARNIVEVPVITCCIYMCAHVCICALYAHWYWNGCFFAVYFCLCKLELFVTGGNVKRDNRHGPMCAVWKSFPLPRLISHNTLCTWSASSSSQMPLSLGISYWLTCGSNSSIRCSMSAELAVLQCACHRCCLSAVPLLACALYWLCRGHHLELDAFC